MRKLRPHHLILGFWLAAGRRLRALGRRRRPSPSSTTTRRSAARSSATSRARGSSLLYIAHRRHPRVHRRRSSATGSRTGSGAAPDNRRTTTKNAKRRFGDFRAGVYMQTLLRDPAAGIMHSLIYFSFLVLCVRHDGARDQPPGARELEVPPRRRLPGLRRGRRRRRRHAAHRRRVGDRPPLRAAALPDPHQVQARARRHPRHVPAARRLGLHGRGLPDRPRRPARLRAVVLRRLPAEHAGRRHGRPRRLAPDLVDRPRRGLLRLPACCCRPRCSGTCSPRR